MAFENTPWVVGGGAHIGPEVARILANAASSGQTGVVAIGDLAVQALAVPGGAVRISPGAFIAASNFAGAARQSYVGVALTETVVAIPPQGSSGARFDLLIAEVVDPQYVGSAPTDPDTFEYVRPRLIQGLPLASIDTPNTAKAYLKSQGITGVPLARIAMPASTATVGGGAGNGTITNLRELAQPRTQRVLWARAMVTGDPDQWLTSSTAPGEYFPNIAWNTEIPDWATRVKIIGQIGTVRVPAGPAVQGVVTIRLGADLSPLQLTTQEVGFRIETQTTDTRHNFMVADDLAIPANMRGTVQHTHFRGRYYTTVRTGSSRIHTDGWSAIYIDLEFQESADDFSM